jgi:hypothetical protein
MICSKMPKQKDKANALRILVDFNSLMSAVAK